MKWFDDLSLRAKLFVNFVLSGGVLVAAVIFCLVQVHFVSRDTQEITQIWLPSVQSVGAVSQVRLRYRVRSLEYMLANAGEKEKIEASLADLDTELQSALKTYEPLISSEAERQIYQQALKGVAGYRATVQEAIAAVKAGKEEEAQALRRTAWVKEANFLRDQTDALIKLNREGAERSAARAGADVTAAITGGVGALVIGIALAVLCSFLIARGLAARLGRAVEAARQIAKGNLTVTLPSGNRDEIGLLIGAMNEMQGALRGALRETADSAGLIQGAAKELNTAVGQLNQSSSIQSSAASAIAANVEELTVSINHVTDNTGEAATAAADSDRKAGEGHLAIEKLVAQISEAAGVVKSSAGQMDKLKGESEKISNIVAVIRDIADQTNLLALNAAIEAARAGEAGRGFAVVADEVRKLSERTAVSTNEISRMVAAIQQSTGDAVAGVAHGAQLVDSSVHFAEQAGEAIAHMREMAQRVAELIGEVAGALREQSVASTEVAKKIEDVATQTEESNAIANETSRAAESMSETANAMQALVSRFTV